VRVGILIVTSGLGTVVPPRVCMVCTSPRDRSNSNSSASDSRYSNSNGLIVTVVLVIVGILIVTGN
jgi:hypothetical protein